MKYNGISEIKQDFFTPQSCTIERKGNMDVPEAEPPCTDIRYVIDVSEVEQILAAKQPNDTFNALASLLNENLNIDIKMGSEETSDEEPEDSNDEEPEDLGTSPNGMGSSSTPALEFSTDFSAFKWIENEEYTFHEKEKEHQIIFTGGSLLKTESNKDNIWVVCIDSTEFSEGAKKLMYPIKWILSNPIDSVIVYKNVLGKYILNLFNETQRREHRRFLEEVQRAASFDSSTKRLFYMESKGQFGFVMRNYGPNLYEIMNDENIYFEKKRKVAILLVEEVKSLFEKSKTHGDLKLLNACYHDQYYAKGEKTAQEKLTLIDLDGVTDMEEVLQQTPIFTRSYLHPFLLEEQNTELLCFGPYRIIQDLYSLILTCSQLIFNLSPLQREFLIEYKMTLELVNWLDSVWVGQNLSSINDLFDWVLDLVSEEKGALFWEKIVDASYNRAFKILDALVINLNKMLPVSSPVIAAKALEPAGKAEESNFNIIMQKSETKKQSLNRKEDDKENKGSNIPINDNGSKKSKLDSITPFWKSETIPNKKRKVEPPVSICGLNLSSS